MWLGGRASAGAVLLVLALVGSARAQTAPGRGGAQEEARRKLLEQMGLRKKERTPAPSADAGPPVSVPVPSEPPGG
jgi:hypothetical protein